MAKNTVAKKLRIIIAALILIHCGCCQNINCDVNHCKSLFSTIFKDFLKIGTQHLCRSSDDTVECVNQCLHTFFPDFDFVNSNASITSEVCSYDIQSDLNEHWNCIGDHFHRLLTCMSKYGGMKPTDISSETLKLLSCKKFLDTLNCPYEVLQECDEMATEIVSTLFSNVFKSSMESACKMVSANEAYDLPVIYKLNNSHLSTSACLDKLPHVAGNCFTQYVKNFNAGEIYHCRDPCTSPGGETCLPSSLMNDFYIPVLSFGKHSCKENSAVKVHMQEPSETSISHNSEITSTVNAEGSIIKPAEENGDLVPSDEAKGSDVLSVNNDGVETSTLNYKWGTKEMEHDKVVNTTHSPNFLSHTSVASSVPRPEINLSSDYEADTATEKSWASKFEFCSQYLFQPRSLVI